MEKKSPLQRVFFALQKPNNKICADCKEPNPRWLSTNYGIFLCHQCAEIHKTIFKEESVKSIDDSHNWTPADASAVRKHGNKKSNEYYEYNLNPKDRPNGYDTGEMTKFIKNKYVKKQWVNTSNNKNIFEKINAAINTPGMIVSSLFASLVVLLVLKLAIQKSHKIVGTICLEMVILFEVLSIKSNVFKPNPYILYQSLYALLGFGLINGVVVVLTSRLIRIGLSLGIKGIAAFAVASVMVLIRFGFENCLITLISSIIIFFISKALIAEVPKGDLIFAEKFLE